MRISFDLDDTLICYQPGVPCEPPLSWFWRLWVDDEPLRLGARALMRDLRARRWELWIYTTSQRTPRSVRRWLWCHGVPVRRIINQEVHDARRFSGLPNRPPSKNPAAFGIDLHVDDSDGVRIEGERHGFPVVVVAPEDEDWADKVRDAAEAHEPHPV